MTDHQNNGFPSAGPEERKRETPFEDREVLRPSAPEPVENQPPETGEPEYPKAGAAPYMDPLWTVQETPPTVYAAQQRTAQPGPAPAAPQWGGPPPAAQPVWQPAPPQAYQQPMYQQGPGYGWAPPPQGYQPPAAPMPQPQPPVGYVQRQQAQYQPPVQYQVPVGQAYYGPVQPYPQKKKLSRPLKVFIWVASILAGIAILGFAGFLVYNAVDSIDKAIDRNKYNFPYSDYFGGGQLPILPSPDQPYGGDDAPEFDDGVTPPDSDEPLPDVDVTPNRKGITVEPIPEGEQMSAQEVYERVVKSTVTVAVTLNREGVEQNSTGTGIIATSDGYIITNAHVVLNSKSSRVKVTTFDGQEYDAVVVGADRTTDLAVIKTNDHDFVPAEFGDAGQLHIGDFVIAIGNPGGAKYSGSMTGGYVSGLDRAAGKYSENGMTYLQTDAAINPGNSGGPLVNLYGQVVGINSSKIITEGYEGMGFAIPVSKAQPIINQLLSGGYVKGRVRLGITGSDTQNAMYPFQTGPQGFMISAIDEDSAFAGTDAQVGDIIVAINGEEVTCLEEISNLLLKYAPGEEITVTLYRGNADTPDHKFDVQITLLEDKGETQK